VRAVPSREVFGGGDPFMLLLRHENPGAAINVDVYAALEAYGEVYWYPGWGGSVRHQTMTLFPGSWDQVLVAISALPGSLSPGGPFYLHAALLQPGSEGAIYAYDSAMFRFR